MAEFISIFDRDDKTEDQIEKIYQNKIIFISEKFGHDLNTNVIRMMHKLGIPYQTVDKYSNCQKHTSYVFEKRVPLEFQKKDIKIIDYISDPPIALRDIDYNWYVTYNQQLFKKAECKLPYNKDFCEPKPYFGEMLPILSPTYLNHIPYSYNTKNIKVENYDGPLQIYCDGLIVDPNNPQHQKILSDKFDTDNNLLKSYGYLPLGRFRNISLIGTFQDGKKYTITFTTANIAQCDKYHDFRMYYAY